MTAWSLGAAFVTALLVLGAHGASAHPEGRGARIERGQPRAASACSPSGDSRRLREARRLRAARRLRLEARRDLRRLPLRRVPLFYDGYGFWESFYTPTVILDPLPEIEDDTAALEEDDHAE